MARAETGERLVATDEDSDFGNGMLHALAPIIIGLSGAVIAMAVIAPGVIRHGQLLATVVLMPLLVLSVVIYALSVLNPGPVNGLVLDPTTRTLQLVHNGWFATRRTEVAFADIRHVALAAGYDRDGYATNAAVITLVSGESIPLAMDLDEGRVVALKALIGCAVDV